MPSFYGFFNGPGYEYFILRRQGFNSLCHIDRIADDRVIEVVFLQVCCILYSAL
jgi:hypothetical protein